MDLGNLKDQNIQKIRNENIKDDLFLVKRGNEMDASILQKNFAFLKET